MLTNVFKLSKVLENMRNIKYSNSVKVLSHFALIIPEIFLPFSTSFGSLSASATK